MENKVFEFEFEFSLSLSLSLSLSRSLARSIDSSLEKQKQNKNRKQAQLPTVSLQWWHWAYCTVHLLQQSQVFTVIVQWPHKKKKKKYDSNSMIVIQLIKCRDEKQRLTNQLRINIHTKISEHMEIWILPKQIIKYTSSPNCTNI